MLNILHTSKKGLILQPKVAHFEKFAAAHSAAKLINNFFSRRVLRHSMATTLQICFLHLCLAQIICTEDAIEFFNIFQLLYAWHFNT